MRIGQVVNQIISKGKYYADRITGKDRYQSVQAQYYPDGSFILTAEVKGVKVRFCSDQKYTTVSESPLLGKIRERWRGPYEIERTAPEIVIDVPSTNRKEEILYDDSTGILVGVMRREDNRWLVMARAQGKIFYQGPTMSQQSQQDMASYFMLRFKEESHKLNVKTHKKKAHNQAA